MLYDYLLVVSGVRQIVCSFFFKKLLPKKYVENYKFSLVKSWRSRGISFYKSPRKPVLFKIYDDNVKVSNYLSTLVQKRTAYRGTHVGAF